MDRADAKLRVARVMKYEGQDQMRLRGDGDMEMFYWTPETQLVLIGVLTQRPLQSIHTRTVERVTTP